MTNKAETRGQIMAGLDFKDVANFIVITLNGAATLFAASEEKINVQHLLARRTERMQVNAIGEILKMACQPGMISLAGGISAAEGFPLELIAELNGKGLTTYGANALQYGLTEGFPPLREALAERLAIKGISVGPEEVLVTSGSQCVLDAGGKTRHPFQGFRPGPAFGLLRRAGRHSRMAGPREAGGGSALAKLWPGPCGRVRPG